MAFYSENPVVFESVSAVTATPSVELGVMRTHAGELYQYMYAAKTCSMGVGVVQTGTSGNTVVATGIVSGEFCAGFVKNESLVSGYYGWVLKKGVVDAANGMANSAGADGDVVLLGTDGKIRTAKGSPATAATDFVGGHIVGKVLSAGASATSHLIYVSCY